MALAAPFLCGLLLTTACASGSPPGAFRTTGHTSPAQPSVTPDANLIWRDDFEGREGLAPNSQYWAYETGAGGWGNNELQTYTRASANVALTGTGVLRISAVRDPATGAWTSARLHTRDKIVVNDGLLRARIKMPAGQGLLAAFWMLGSNITTVGYPQSGEIDIAEINRDPTLVYSTIHGPTVADPTQQWQLGSPFAQPAAVTDDFHTYSVQKTAGQLIFGVDDVITAVVTKADVPATDQWVFDQPFYILLNIAVGGTWPGNPDGTTPAPADMLIDWISLSKPVS
jgi:beta-glucanase (GH16 family)